MFSVCLRVPWPIKSFLSVVDEAGRICCKLLLKTTAADKEELQEATASLAAVLSVWSQLDNVSWVEEEQTTALIDFMLASHLLCLQSWLSCCMSLWSQWSAVLWSQNLIQTSMREIFFLSCLGVAIKSNMFNMMAHLWLKTQGLAAILSSDVWSCHRLFLNK